MNSVAAKRFADTLKSAATANPLIGLVVTLPDTCSTCGHLVAIVGPGKHLASLRCRSCRTHRGWVSHTAHKFLTEIVQSLWSADRADQHPWRRCGGGLMSPAQLQPVYLLTLQPARGRDGIRGLRALLKAAGRRYGLRAIEVRELPAKPAKRARRARTKFVSKTDEPPALSRRQVTCNIKDLQVQKDDVFPSKYLKHTDLQGKPTVMTIESAVLETLKSPRRQDAGQNRPVFCGSKEIAAAQRDELRRRRRYLRRRH